MVDTNTIKQLAEEYRKAFTLTISGGEKPGGHDERDEIWTLKRDEYGNPSGGPADAQELVAAAHNQREMFPDDYRYEWTVDALDAFMDSYEPEDAIVEVEQDIYTHDLIAWLGSRADRYAYVDDALDSGLVDVSASSIIDMIGVGQREEKQEVYQAVYGFLVERAEEIEESEEGEPEYIGWLVVFQHGPVQKPIAGKHRFDWDDYEGAANARREAKLGDPMTAFHIVPIINPNLVDNE